MIGGVVRIAGPEEKTREVARRVVERLIARGNAAHLVDPGWAGRFGVGAGWEEALSLSGYFGSLGVWSVVVGPDVPLGTPSPCIDVQCATFPIEGVLELPEDSAAAADLILEEASLAPGMTPPVILVGKGGSGTRVLSEACRASGLFLGSDLNETGDSLEMKDVSYIMLHEHAGKAELPAGVPEHAAEIRRAAARMLARGDCPLGAPWGWKLPETMLFLPLAIEAFPEAKILHLVRHPCGTSLRRDLHLADRWEHHLGRAVIRSAAAAARVDLADFARMPPWIRAAHSWAFQVLRVRDWCAANLAPGRYLEVRFEDLVEGGDKLARIASFAGLRRMPWRSPVDRARAIHWDGASPRAADVWSIAGDVATLLGYSGP